MKKWNISSDRFGMSLNVIKKKGNSLYAKKANKREREHYYSIVSLILDSVKW